MVQRTGTKSRPATSGSPFPRGIGRPATGALLAAGFTRMADLTRVSEADLLALHGVGPKAIGVLRQALATEGLAFAARPGLHGDWPACQSD